jgi:hypothetical protein
MGTVTDHLVVVMTSSYPSSVSPGDAGIGLRRNELKARK